MLVKRGGEKLKVIGNIDILGSIRSPLSHSNDDQRGNFPVLLDTNILGYTDAFGRQLSESGENDPRWLSNCQLL